MRTLLLSIIAFTAVCCTSNADVKVKVINTIDAARAHQTVELTWADLKAKMPELSNDNVIVLDAKGAQVPSQVIFNGNADAQSLIFQVDVAAKDSASFTVKTGVREDYKQLTFSRFVPERFDDYAWENNVMGYRAYGPALIQGEGLITNGFDVWCKRTQELVIDKWYASKDYHTDKGEGCDVFKVGTSFGCGASMPYVDQTLCPSVSNYESYETLDNGPIRTSFKLVYGTSPAGKNNVAVAKQITLDAYTNFFKVEEVYTGDFTQLPIAAGVVMHEGQTSVGSNYIAFMEPASDSKTKQDGDIATAVIMPGMNSSAVAKTITKDKKGTNDNLIAIGTASAGKPFVYYAGAGWSKAGVESLEKWIEIIRTAETNIANPLVVKVQ